MIALSWLTGVFKFVTMIRDSMLQKWSLAGRRETIDTIKQSAALSPPNAFRNARQTGSRLAPTPFLGIARGVEHAVYGHDAFFMLVRKHVPETDAPMLVDNSRAHKNACQDFDESLPNKPRHSSRTLLLTRSDDLSTRRMPPLCQARPQARESA